MQIALRCECVCMVVCSGLVSHQGCGSVSCPVLIHHDPDQDKTVNKDNDDDDDMGSTPVMT